MDFGQRNCLEIVDLFDFMNFLVWTFLNFLAYCVWRGYVKVYFYLFAHQVRRLWYDNSRKLELDNLLLVVAQTGVFIYSAFCIIGSFFEMQDHLMSFLASLATLVQTTLQTVFILDASR